MFGDLPLFCSVCKTSSVFDPLKHYLIKTKTWKNLAPAEVFVVPASPVQSPALAVPRGPQTIHLRILTIR